MEEQVPDWWQVLTNQEQPELVASIVEECTLLSSLVADGEKGAQKPTQTPEDVFSTILDQADVEANSGCDVSAPLQSALPAPPKKVRGMRITVTDRRTLPVSLPVRVTGHAFIENCSRFHKSVRNSEAKGAGTELSLAE